MSELNQTAQWPTRNMAVVSDDKNLLPILKELLRSKSWTVEDNLNNMKETINLRLENQIDGMIIIDSPVTPASETLRTLFKESRVRLTPTLIIGSHENSVDLLLYEKIYKVTPCSKPLTANNFNNAFSKMISLWQTPLMTALRKLSLIPDEHNERQKLEILSRLLTSPAALPFALSTSTQILSKMGHQEEAETQLLTQFKINLQDPAILAICGWFYLDNNTPSQAIRFFEKLKSIAPTSSILNLDLTNAYLTMGELSLAFTNLYEWGKRNQGYPRLNDFLAKILIADGKAEKYAQFGIPKQVITKHLRDWEILVQDPSTANKNITKEPHAS
jgi:tetratricopeptide (TPR) repeat protein